MNHVDRERYIEVVKGTVLVNIDDINRGWHTAKRATCVSYNVKRMFILNICDLYLSETGVVYSFYKNTSGHILEICQEFLLNLQAIFYLHQQTLRHAIFMI